MKVEELIKELEKMPKDADVAMFDGPTYYTPSRVFVCDWGGNLKDKVIID